MSTARCEPRSSRQQPKSSPHTPIPAAKLFLLFVCFFYILFHGGKTLKSGVGIIRKHSSTRKRECARIMLLLMSQVRFHILGWG